MEASFWHQRWESKQLGFHTPEPNSKLTHHFNTLNLEPGSRIFVPLCGKTVDMNWLLDQGMQVVGAELSAIAVEEFFEALAIKPQKIQMGELTLYSAPESAQVPVAIFQGDVLALKKEHVGQVDAVYDRAALVALPSPMRKQYTAHLLKITAQAPQLVICFVYDQQAMDGPPFSIADAELQTHYAAAYTLKCLETTEIPGGLKGKCHAEEKIWLLN